MLLRTLGGLALEPALIRRPKPLLLLAYLAVEGSKERRHLMELFWPEAEDPSTSLRMTLSRLREAGSGLFISDDRTITTRVESDIAELQSALEKHDCAKVLEVYQGEFLAGFSLPDWGAELEEWVYSTREFIGSQVRSALIRQGELTASQGKFAEAAEWAEKAYRLGGSAEPQDLERLYLLLSAGDSTLSNEVRKQAREYGLELTQAISEAKARFYSAPTHIESLPAPPHNLPIPKTSFVGRDPELLELSAVEQQTRLLTLLGPGGIGKTRLALQFAHNQLTEGRFKDGVFFVVLDALSHPEQIPQALAGVLQVQGGTKGNLLQTITAQIGPKHLLLILDNFEHLMDGALLVSQLLEACPNLKVLVTSRERLNLEEEFVLPLRGLHVPQAKKLEPSEAEYNDAVRLFVQRAKRARLEFELTPQNLPEVLQICQMVEGSPLGIELATVWLRTLSPKEIAEEILHNLGRLESPSRNLPERHHSLQAVFEHSWRLLSAKEQAVLSKLTVFIGGFTREAAGAVTDATIPVLTSLVDKSMLRQSEGRYDFHVLLHQFAQEKQQNRAETQAKHANYFLHLIEAAAPELQGPHKATWLARLALEHENFNAVLDWALKEGCTELGLRLAGALHSYWMVRGHVHQGGQWLERFLTLDKTSANPAPVPVRSLALTAAAWMAHAEDNFAHATQLFEESAALRRQSGQQDGLAALMVNEAMQARSDGDYNRATAILEQTLERHRAEDNRAGIANDGIGLSLSRLGLVLTERGQYERARALWEECLALHRSLGDRGGIAASLLGLSDIAREQGQTARLRMLAGEALEIFRDLGEQWGVGFALNNLALGEYFDHHLSQAALLAEESATGLRTIWNGAPIAEVLSTVGLIAVAQGNLEQAQSALSESLKRGWDFGPRWLVAVDLEGLSALKLGLGQPERAAGLLGASHSLRAAIGAPLSPLRRPLYDRSLAEAQSLLGKNWEAAWKTGADLSPEAAIALALEPGGLEGDTVSVYKDNPGPPY